MVGVCVFDKGRARSFALNALCRRAAAYQVGCAIRWRVRHIPTDRMIADFGSRNVGSRVLRPGSCAMTEEEG